MRGLDWGCDYGGYVLQAKTLVSGDYKGLQENMNRNEFVLNYPWGFPFVLAPVIGSFDTDPVLIKEYVFLFFVVSLILVYFLFRKEPEYALFTVLLLATNPYFWYFKNHLFADFPNLCFVLFSLALIQKFIVGKKQFINSYLDNCLVGLTVFISFSMRTQSIMLLITLLIMQVYYFRKELLRPKIMIAALLPYVVFFILNFLMNKLIPIPSVSYREAYEDAPLLDTIWNNIFYYTNVWKALVSDIKDLGQVDGIVAGVFILLFLVGISIKWRDNLLYIVFIICSFAPLFIAAFYQGLRYLIPVVPFFFYFMVKGAFYLTTSLYQKRGNRIAYFFVGLFAFFSLRSIALLSYTNYYTPFLMEGPYQPASLKLFEFLKQNTAKQDLIGFWKPRAMLLYSGRNSIVPRSYAECIVRNANYYVYYRNAGYDQIALDSLTLYPGRFTNIYEDEDFKVFKVVRNPMFNTPPEIKDLKPMGAGELVLTINYDYFDSSILQGPEKLIPIWSNDIVSSKTFKLPAGNYLLSFYAKGTKAAGQFAQNKISLNEQVLGVFYSQEKPSRTDLLFELQSDGEVKLNLKLENDLMENNEDRNTLIYFINIYKVKN